MTVVLPKAARRKELGQLLMEKGLLTEEQLTSALAQQQRNGRTLGQVLFEMQLVAEEDITRARAEQVDVGYVMMWDVVVDPTILPLVSASVAHKYLILPVNKTPDGALNIVVSAWNARVMDIAHKIASAHHLRVVPSIASEGALRVAIDHWYGPTLRANAMVGVSVNHTRQTQSSQTSQIPLRSKTGASAVPAIISTPTPAAPGNGTPEKRASDVFAGTLPSGITTSNFDSPLDSLEGMGVDQPVIIQFVNRILADAITRGASDVHFEPRRDTLDIRIRIDGVLRNIDSVRREFQPACSSRIKIMAEMNIAERRLPQDGRLSVMLEGRTVDMRVSSLPTQYGESIVLRILDKNGILPNLSQLGFSPNNLKMLQNVIHKPHGIVLATGPTGSGKTTTLYSAIQEIHAPDVNIITVEDPIEYELEGIRQSNVNEKAGLTFARQLRAILRQDPDVIYVGEIRDSETAEIAFRAALTGHLVFSSLHCNDAAGAVTRLLNMGMDPFLVASSVVGILAQRLVRKVCVQCAKPIIPSDMEIAAFGIDTDSPQFHAAHFQRGYGCEACGGTGYRGRCSIQEMMVMDDTIRALTLSRTPSHKIRQSALERGMISMQHDAGEKIMQGITTFEEAQKKVYIEESGDE